jgi:hypothetical protein
MADQQKKQYLSEDEMGFGSAAKAPKYLSEADMGFAPADAGGFVASAKQSVGSLIKGAGQAAADFIPGVGQDNTVKQYGQSVIDANPTAVKSLGDIADKPGTAVKEAAGNAAGSIGGIVGARLLGNAITAAAPFTGPLAPATAAIGQGVAWLGPYAAAALPSFGGIREQQVKEDPNNQDSIGAKARAAGGAAAVALIENKFGPQQWALSAVSKEGRKQLAEKFAAKSLTGSIAKGAAKGAAVEGAEELAQNPIEQLAAYQDPTTAENLQDTAFSGAMGALGGGAFGGGIGGASRVSQGTANQQQPPAAEAPPPAAAPAPAPAPVLDEQALERAGVMPPPVLDDQQISRKVDLESGAPIPYTPPPAEELAAMRKAAMGIDPAAGPLSAGAAIAVESQAAEDVRLGAASTLADGAERARQAQAERAAWEAANPGIPYEPESLAPPDNRPAPAATPEPSGSFGAMNDFADLLNQERQDVTQRRVGIAERQGQRREFDLAEADRRTAESMQREAQARRQAVLDAVLADPETTNPAGRFAAMLRREGYRDSAPTADELQTIQRFEDVRAAQPAPLEVEPSAPNELDPAAMGIRERRGPAQPATLAPPKTLQEGIARARAARASAGAIPSASAAQPSANPGEAWAGMDAKQRADLAGRLQGVPAIITKNVHRASWAKINPALQGKLAEAMAPRAAPQIEGADLGDGWAAFSSESGTAGVPRAAMPQIKAEHRGAMVNFMNARGVQHREETVPAASLKPTQAEFSHEKVARAKTFEGGSRSILVSADNHVLDGHHQWMSARDKGEDVKVIRLDAPIRDLVGLAHDFPSSTTAGGSASEVVTNPATPMEKSSQSAQSQPETPVAAGAAGSGQSGESASPALGQALKILMDRTDGIGAPDGLGGPEHADARTAIISALTGERAADIEAAPNFKFRTSVPQVERLLYDAAGIPAGKTLKDRRSPFLDWLDQQQAGEVAQPTAELTARAEALDQEMERKLQEAESDQDPIKNETRADAGPDAKFAPAEQEPIKNQESPAAEASLRFSRGSRQASEFVAAPDGSIDFGEITPEMAQAMRRQAGKIRLERGDYAYGLEHIEARHGDQIRAIGFESVEAFVADAVRHIDSIWLPTKTSQLVVLQSEERGKAVFIELKPAESGDYYTVNTAFPVGEGYVQGKEKRGGWRELWSREPVPASTPGGQSDSASTPLKAGEVPSMDRGQSSVPSVANPDADGTPKVQRSTSAAAKPSGITAESLPGIFAERFPKLAGAIRTMLDRGALGQKGGLVVIGGAQEFADHSGRKLDDAVQLFESGDGIHIKGLYDKKTGITYLVGPNLTKDSVSAVVLHEMVHGQQRQVLDQKALALIDGRDKQAPALRAFLDRVAERMEAVGETGNPFEATSYIVEMAVQEGRQAGFSAADGPILAWIERNIGKPVADLVRGFAAMVRAWALSHGVTLKNIAVDDLVAYAKAGVREAARGNVVTNGKAAPAPAFSRGQVRQARPAASIAAAWEAPEPSKLFGGRIDKDSLIYTLQNKQIDMKRVVDAIAAKIGQIADDWNPYLQEELFHGRSAKGVKDFLTKEMRPLITRMRLNRVEMGEFERFLHARHAKEANDHIAKINPGNPEFQDGGSGMTNQEARDIMAALSPERRKALDSLAAQVDVINTNTRKLLVASGLETAETVKAWEAAYKHYVPLQREDAESGGLGIGQGFSVRGSAAKRRTGSTRAVVDILANIAMQRERTIVRAEKNRVAQALYALSLKAPNPDFWMPINPDEAKAMKPAERQKIAGELVALGLDPADAQNFVKEPVERYVNPATGLVAERINPTLRNRDNVLAVRVNGKDRFVFFNQRDERAQRMAGALKNLDADQLGRMLQVSAKVTRWFAAVNTQYNPIFGIVNALRDGQSALLQLSTTPIRGDEAKVLAGAVPAMKGIYAGLRRERAGAAAPSGEWSKLWEDFQQNGGQTGFRDQFANSQDRADALRRELDPTVWADGPLAKIFKADGALRVPLGIAQKRAAGLFGWLSDYNDMMENGFRLSAYKAALDRGMSKQQAASIAKNLTVNFNRKGQVASQAGALYAFFNASMQGTARLWQTLNGPLGRKIIGGGLALGVLQALMLAAAGFGDDDPPEFVRERSIVIPLADGKYASIPMPLGYHVIPSFSRITTEWALGGFKDTAKRFGDILGLLADTFNPIGNAGISVQTIAPTAVDPLVALAENRDYTGKPIAQQDFNGLSPTPGHTRAKDTASGLSKAIAYWANLASGGTNYKPGLISPTPDQLDYLIGQITGGVGREYLKGEQTVSSLFSGEELPTHKIPLLGRFYGDTQGQSSEGARYYANLKEIHLHRAEVEGRRKDGGDVAGYLAENPAARLGMAGPLKVENEVRKLRESKRDALEKGQTVRVKMIDARITALMKQFNERVAGLQ